MRLVTGRLPVLTFDLERGNIPLARPYRGWVLAPGRLPLHFCMNVLSTILIYLAGVLVTKVADYSDEENRCNYS